MPKTQQGPECPGLSDEELGTTGWGKGQESSTKHVWKRKPVPKYVTVGYPQLQPPAFPLPSCLRPCSFWDAEIHQGGPLLPGWATTQRSTWADRPYFFANPQHRHFWPVCGQSTILRNPSMGTGTGGGQPQHLPQASLSPTRPVQPSSLMQAAAITAASAHTPMEPIFPFCKTDFNSFPTTPWQ